MDFLSPDRHDASKHYHDPYTTSGARTILRRFSADVIAMLDAMIESNRKYGEGAKTFLAQSPLRSRVYVAAAMKTLGLVSEVPSPNGACALVLTERAIKQIEDLRRFL